MARSVAKSAKKKTAKSRRSRSSSRSSSVNVLGAMTGTSCDGLDVAIVTFTSESWQPTWTASFPYPKELRKRVLAAQNPGTRLSLKEISELDRDLGIWYGETFKSVIRSLPPKHRPQLISNHGQTVAHFPDLDHGGITLQLGDPNQIVERTGITTVSHHRYGDMATGGQGAPFLPAFHLLLASSLVGDQGGVAFHNLGGISNFTYVGPKGKILASDTGVANLWIDAAASWLSKGRQSFDPNGQGALEGEIDVHALKALLAHPFLKRGLPKTTGRDDFPIALLEKFLKKMKRDTILPTLTAYTVESIAQAYENFILKKRLPLKKIILVGGGTRNDTLVSWLKSRLYPIEVDVMEDFGLDAQYIEAQGFAYLGYRALHGLALGGVWTEGEKAKSGGRLTPGTNWKKLVGDLARR